MTLAEQYEKDEQYEKAYEEYQKQYEREKDNPHIIEKLAHIAAILNKKDEAAAYYKSLVALDDKNIVAYEKLMDISFENNDKFTYYLARAQVHILQEQYEHAINDLKKSISHGSDEYKTVSARYILAGLCEKTNKYNQAIDEYLKISDTENASSETYLKLANLYDKTGFTESAVEMLLKAKNDGYENLDEDLAKYYLKTGDFQNALDLTQSALLKIKCLLNLGKHSEAFELLTSISSQYKNDAEYRILTAQYYFETNDLDTALEKVDKFADISPNSPLIYQMKALIYEKKGDEFLEHVNWAKFNNLRGDTDIALNEYTTAHQINPNDVDIVATLADMLNQTDKNRSIEFYEKLLKLQPANKRALEKLAEFRESIGDYAEMKTYLDELKRIDPRNPYVMQNYERACRLALNPPSLIDNIMNFFKKI